MHEQESIKDKQKIRIFAKNEKSEKTSSSLAPQRIHTWNEQKNRILAKNQK